MEERNSLLTFPSLARQRGHSSLFRPGVGLYTVSLQLGQFRYAMGTGGYPLAHVSATYG